MTWIVTCHVALAIITLLHFCHLAITQSSIAIKQHQAAKAAGLRHCDSRSQDAIKLIIMRMNKYCAVTGRYAVLIFLFFCIIYFQQQTKSPSAVVQRPVNATVCYRSTPYI